jgi:hypothetical protein
MGNSEDLLISLLDARIRVQVNFIISQRNHRAVSYILTNTVVMKRGLKATIKILNAQSVPLTGANYMLISTLLKLQIRREKCN